MTTAAGQKLDGLRSRFSGRVITAADGDYVPGPLASWNRTPGAAIAQGRSRRLREGDCLMDDSLVLGAEGCFAWPPGSPDSTADVVGDQIPVPAAHQAGRVDPLVAADDRAALRPGR